MVSSATSTGTQYAFEWCTASAPSSFSSPSFFVIVAVKETAHNAFLSASTVALARAAAPPLHSHVSRTAAAFAASTGAGTTRHLYLVGGVGGRAVRA